MPDEHLLSGWRLALQRKHRPPGRLWTRLGLGGRVVFVLAMLLLLVGLGFAAVFGGLMWRLASGPIEVENFEDTIGVLIAEQFGDARAEIETVSVARDDDGDLVVQLFDLRLFDARGKQILRAPLATMGTSLFAVATGVFTPTSIELIGPNLQIRRLLDGSVQLEFVESEQSAPDRVASAGTQVAPTNAAAPAASRPSNAGDASADVSGILNILNSLEVRDARLTVFDEASGTVWRSFSAQLSYRRRGEAITATLDAPFSTDSGDWRIAARLERDNATGPTRLQTRFIDVVPSEIAARIPQFSVLTGFDLPVTGSIDLSLAGAGIDSAALVDLKVDLTLGAGFFRGFPDQQSPMEPILVDEGRIGLRFNKSADRLDIETFEIFLGKNRLNLAGFATIERGEKPAAGAASGEIIGLAFALTSQNAQLSAEDLGLPPVLVRQASLAGRVQMSPLGVELTSASVVLDRGTIELSGRARFGQDPLLQLTGTIRDLPVFSMVQLWPRQSAPDARGWVAQNISSGTLTSAAVMINLQAADFEAVASGQPLRNDAVSVDVGLAGVTARYMDALPPIEGGAGRATIQGDRFVLSMDAGFVRSPSGTKVGVTFGRFSIPTFQEVPNAGYVNSNISVALAGALGATMEILDLEPLGFARAIGVKPADIVGNTEVNLRVTLPLLSTVEFNQIQIQAGAILKDVLVPNMFGDVDLTAESLEIIATQRNIQAAGDVRMASVPATLKWRAEFGDGGAREDRLTLSTKATARELKKFGINITGLVEGSIPMTIVALGNSKALQVARIDADVTNAKVTFSQIGWIKQPGRPARLKFEAETLDNGQIRLRNINLRGKGIDVRGAIRLAANGSLYKIDIERLRLDGTTDISINGVRGQDRNLSLIVKGKSLDARAILKRLGKDKFKNRGNARSAAEGVQGANVSFSIASMRGRGKTFLKNVSGTMRIRQKQVRLLRLKGRFASQGALILNYAGSAKNPAVLNIDTDDAGGFFRLVGLYNRAIGGRMTLRAKGSGAGELVGVASVRKFTVVNEPLLAQLFANQRSGRAASAKKVPFNKMQIKFRRVGDIVEIKNALLAGPSVGASFRGRVNTENQAVSLNGTYVPAYGINAALSTIPLVGTILTGRVGEGVVGMTFGVTGTMDNPNISINPLSAVAPGFLRLFFEFQSR